MKTYAEFLASKQRKSAPAGRNVQRDDICGVLHEWQKDVVVWACDRGRAAIFADCGLGKTFMQLEWARLMSRPGKALICAPLSVARQTIREAVKLDIDAQYITGTPQSDGVYVTNYERLDRIDTSVFDAVVLDESSILKNYVGKTRTALIDAFANTPYRLACTATPAPNDVAEITNHAEFLGRATRQDMLGAYFITDMDKNDGGGYRVKGHALHPMHQWMAQWACAIRKPGDLGYPNEGYDLPSLEVVPEIVQVEVVPDGQLFATDLGGVGGRAAVRRETMHARVERAVELMRDDQQWIAWCGLNDEASAVTKALGDDAVNVEGSWDPDRKAAALEAFQDGEVRVLVTKPSIAGFGMNFQNAARMTFVGIGDSYESYYQCVRRCWRYGQRSEVKAHVVVSDLENQIVQNVQRKEVEANETVDLLIRYSTVETTHDMQDDRPQLSAVRSNQIVATGRAS